MSSANGTRYPVSVAAAVPAGTPKSPPTSGSTDAVIAPPKGPRNPPAYNAATRTRDRDLSTGADFTGDIAGAVRAIREIDAGNIHINWTPLWRADLMPYGGLKGSGIGKEGPRTAVAEMTEEKTVVLHGRPW